jgi:hypothetical protein
MRAKEFESSIVRGSGGNTWLRLALVFVAAPLLWLLLGYWFGEQLIFSWLAVASAYSVALLVGANSPSPMNKDSHQRSELSRLLAARLSPLFWGSVLVATYLFTYGYLFDRENFFPR